jgi:L-fuconolactonase
VTIPVVDSHLHLWDRSRSAYTWLTPQHGALYADFTPRQARAELDVAGVDRAILVQADDTTADTEFLLEIAESHPWVAGVVGWVPLDDTAAAVRALDALASRPALVGIRHLVHDDPRDDFLELASVRASLGEVAARGLAFDVPDAWPRHLAATVRLAAALPELTVVIDHLAKPPIEPQAVAAWQALLTQAAALPNTVAKLSGLQRPGTRLDEATIRALCDLALELFGAQRLMYGGDWPMTLSHGGYQAVWSVMHSLIGELPATQATAILGGTAARVYRLGDYAGYSS